MLKNSPDINKEGGGVGNPDIKMDSMQAKGFSQDKQATGGKDTPKDIRGGKPPPSPLLHEGTWILATDIPVPALAS